MTNGKYDIPLPMKEKPIIVPDSEPMAFERLQRLKRKFKDNEYYRQYDQFMINLLDKGYAEEVPTCDVKNQQAWYIPHFRVRHPTKSNRVRVVFDCAARVNNLPFNDLLRQGPEISNLFLGVFLRFRLGLHAYIADIKTMYYQVKMPEGDRDYLRFLRWKAGQIGGDIVKLRITYPFGACCSPSILNYALKQVVQDYGGQFQASVGEIVLNNFYVDDLLVSSDDINDLIDTSANVIDLCRKGGFNLTKFSSNSLRFMNSLPKEKYSECVEQFIKNKEVERKTLGLNWSLIQDKISISLDIDAIPSTKRELLAVIGKVYDPLAESVVNAFIRFVSRWGTVSELISDHGTNFIGASKVLKEHLVARQIGIELAKRGVDWAFTSSGGSYYGGIFERKIDAVRRVLDFI
ncbi:uncharacterized protein LOC143026841 [Oratosquilla oratoria]|uniref:uncharacterized protein LOC143026841 n=1 Tax=Oratosquilla oratoria TaxID=337810 RepID=UPI003F76DAEF